MRLRPIGSLPDAILRLATSDSCGCASVLLALRPGGGGTPAAPGPELTEMFVTSRYVRFSVVGCRDPMKLLPLGLTLLAGCARPAPAPAPAQVVFVCEHGAAKSVVASQ